MSPGSLPPPALPGMRNLWAGGASRVAASCPGQRCLGDAVVPGLALGNTQLVMSRNAPHPAAWKCCCWSVLGLEMDAGTKCKQWDQCGVCRALLQ